MEKQSQFSNEGTRCDIIIDTLWLLPSPSFSPLSGMKPEVKGRLDPFFSVSSPWAALLLITDLTLQGQSREREERWGRQAHSSWNGTAALSVSVCGFYWWGSSTLPSWAVEEGRIGIFHLHLLNRRYRHMCLYSAHCLRVLPQCLGICYRLNCVPPREKLKS